MNIRHRIFSLEEANGIIPHLETCIAKLQEKKDLYTKHHDMVFMEELLDSVEKKAELGSDSSSERFMQEIEQLENGLGVLRQEIQAVYDLGCVLRSIDQGAIDLLGNLDGKMIYYCWRKGEKTIRYYHFLHGHAGERWEIDGPTY